MFLTEQVIEKMKIPALQLMDEYEQALKKGEPYLLAIYRQAILYRIKQDELPTPAEALGIRYNGTKAEVHPFEKILRGPLASDISSSPHGAMEAMALLRWCSFGRVYPHVAGTLDLFSDLYDSSSGRCAALISSIAGTPKQELIKSDLEPDPHGNIARLLAKRGWVVTKNTWVRKDRTSDGARTRTGTATTTAKQSKPASPSKPSPSKDEPRSPSGPTLF